MSGKAEEPDTERRSIEILGMIGIICLSMWGGHFLRKTKIVFIQEAGFTILVGVAAGGLIQVLGYYTLLKDLSDVFV